MTPAWSPTFDFYDADFDGLRTSVFLDLEAWIHSPVATHPARLLVRVAMLHPRADGLRSEEEAEALFGVEDTVAERITQDLEAFYVGRLVAEGHLTFVFYLPNAHAARADAECGKIAGDVAPYSIAWSVAEDAAWAYYRELLYPDENTLAEMLSRRARDRVMGVGG
jgi:hypothetical protein